MPLASTRKPRPKSKIHGLYPRNFPRSVRWMVDQDYSEQLTPEEKAWLADFNDKHYGAKFAKDSEHTWPLEDKRASYRAKNVANNDYYTKVPPEMIVPWNPGPGGSDREASTEDAYVRSQIQEGHWVDPCEFPVHDPSPTPEYLNSEVYKRAVQKFRAHLTQTRREVAPEDTPELADAWLELEISKDENYVEVPDPEDAGGE